MKGLHFANALLADGWAQDVRISVSDGRISAIVSGVPPQGGDETHAIGLPGVANVHSHAFQRGMAGLAERRGPDEDNFWGWREAMYRYALTMAPEDLEAVAAQLYAEMLEAGFTRVGEFHYLHHDRDGTPYNNIGELAERIAAASVTAGISLTLLPVYYANATFGGVAPQARQRRFICGVDQFARLYAQSTSIVERIEGGMIGLAPHSLRAVGPDDLAAILPLAGHRPIHIHAAEQQREVDDCLAWSGQRPVEWLLDHAPVDSRWCLIHATHLTQDETERLALSGAVAGLCPITEANLGDGFFNAPDFLEAGGHFGVGSDSDIHIGLAEELRQLEYSQRLRHQKRNVLAAPGGATGERLLAEALRGGARAMGQDAHGLTVGAPADIVTLAVEHPALVARKRDEIVDSWIFAAGSNGIDCVYARGQKLVAGGKHVRREAIGKAFAKAMVRLAG